MRPLVLIGALLIPLVTGGFASADPPIRQVEVVNLPETQNVSGTVEVTNLPEVQDVFVVNEPPAPSASSPYRTVVRDADGTLVGVVDDFQRDSSSWTDVIVDLDGRDVAIRANASGIVNDSSRRGYFEAIGDCSGEVFANSAYHGFHVRGSVWNSTVLYVDATAEGKIFNPRSLLRSGYDEASCLNSNGAVAFEPPDRCCFSVFVTEGDFSPALVSELPPFTLPLRIVKEPAAGSAE